MDLRAIAGRTLLTGMLAGLLVTLAGAVDGPALPANVVATLKGHTDTVYAIAFSPDGRYILTGSFDKSLKLWDAAGGKLIKTFEGPQGHQNLVLCAAFSPDGQLFASGSSDNNAKIWDVPLRTPVRELAQAAGSDSLALSPDGKRLAAGGKDGAVKILEAADGKLVFNLAGVKAPFANLVFSGNGQVLAGSDADGNLRWWNAGNGQPMGTLGAQETTIASLNLSGGGEVGYTVGSDGLLKFWNLRMPAPRNLAAHAAPITCLALSQDGQMVVTGSEDKSVHLVNFDNGQLLRPLAGPTTAVMAVAVSPNKAIVAAGTSDGKLFVWNAGDSKLLFQVAAHGKAITSVAFHPQGNQLVTGSTDGMLKVWPAMPGQQAVKPVKELQAHAGGVASAVFHNNGTQVLSGGADKTVKLWDVAAGKAVRSLGPLADPVTDVVFSRDFSQIAAAAGKIVKAWNAADGKEMATLNHPVVVTTLSFNGDKTRLATGAADNRIRVWEMATGKALEFFTQPGPMRGLAFHPNNQAIVSASSDKAAVASMLSIQRLVVVSAAPVRSVAVTPDGARLVIAAEDKSVKVWNLGNGANERAFPAAEAPVTTLAVSRNSALLAVGEADKKIRLFNFADGKPVGMLPAPGIPRSLVFSPNHQFLAVACDNKELINWNVTYNPGQQLPPEFGKAEQSYGPADIQTAIHFSPDNTLLYSGGPDKNIQTWKLASSQPLKNLGHGNLVDAVAFSPDGKLLATGCHDGNLRIWNVDNGQMVRQIQAHVKPAAAPIYCLAWTLDGKQLVSGSFDHTMKLWDAGNGNPVREFKAYKVKEFEKGHRDGVFCLAFSRDGKLLASGSSDRTLKIWDVATAAVVRECINSALKSSSPGALPEPPHAHPGYVNSLRFTPDGSRLVSVGGAPGNRGYLAVWNVADAKLLQGEELPLGWFYGVAISPDGKLLGVACGPQDRNFQDVASYLLKMPEPDQRQASQARK